MGPEQTLLSRQFPTMDSSCLLPQRFSRWADSRFWACLCWVLDYPIVLDLCCKFDTRQVGGFFLIGVPSKNYATIDVQLQFSMLPWVLLCLISSLEQPWHFQNTYAWVVSRHLQIGKYTATNSILFYLLTSYYNASLVSLTWCVFAWGVLSRSRQISLADCLLYLPCFFASGSREATELPCKGVAVT